MKEFLGVTKALSDGNRLKIIKALQHGPMFVSELQHALGIAQPTVSKHLKVLEEAGLVVSHPQGTWVRYHITKDARNPYIASILGNLRHWLEKDIEIMEPYKILQASREHRQREEHT